MFKVAQNSETDTEKSFGKTVKETIQQLQFLYIQTFRTNQNDSIKQRLKRLFFNQSFSFNKEISQKILKQKRIPGLALSKFIRVQFNLSLVFKLQDDGNQHKKFGRIEDEICSENLQEIIHDCSTLSKEVFEDVEELGDSKILDIAEVICASCNNEGGLVFIGERNCERDEILRQTTFTQFQKESIEAKLKNIIKERILPQAVAFNCHYIKVKKKQTQNIRQLGINFYLKSLFQRNGQEKGPGEVKEILAVHFCPGNPEKLYAVCKIKSKNQSQYEIFLKNEDKEIVIPKPKFTYKFIHEFYREKLRNKIKQFYCDKSYRTQSRRFGISPKNQKNKIMDLEPSQQFKFGYIISLGSHSKSDAIVRASETFNKHKIQFVFSKPFERQLLKSNREIYFLSSQQKFLRIEEILKTINVDQVFHSLIVVTRFLIINVKFIQNMKVFDKLENSLIKRYGDKVFWKQEDSFEICYQFVKEDMCLFAYCLLENENIFSRFITHKKFGDVKDEMKKRRQLPPDMV